MVLDGPKFRFEKFKHFFRLPPHKIWKIMSLTENFETNPQMAIFMENRDFEHFLSSKWLSGSLKGEFSKKFRDPLKWS